MKNVIFLSTILFFSSFVSDTKTPKYLLGQWKVVDVSISKISDTDFDTKFVNSTLEFQESKNAIVSNTNINLSGTWEVNFQSIPIYTDNSFFDAGTYFVKLNFVDKNTYKVLQLKGICKKNKISLEGKQGEMKYKIKIEKI